MRGRTILAFVIVTLVIAAVVTFTILDKRVPRDPSDHGNSAGNLHNGGLFFEMDGKVYFSNPYDSDCLYSMNPDERLFDLLSGLRL